MTNILLTFQDFQQAISENKKAEFIQQAIADKKASNEFQDAKTAQAYYARKNVAIMKRLGYLERVRGMKVNVTFHKLCSGFFPMFVKQLSQYLLGNGVSIDEKIKEKLGRKFDNTLQKMGIYALVDGACWGFWNKDTLMPFRIADNGGYNGFFVLPDELTGEPMVGIKFSQIDSDKPMVVELFEADGITKYKTDDKTLIETTPKTAYIQTVRRDAISTETIGEDNYCVLPIFPLYANELHQSELDNGLKGLIDAYDFVLSDLIDDITQNEGMYKVVKNFGGAELSDLLNELMLTKSTYTDSKDTGVDINAIEVPYQAKQTALTNIRNQAYSDFMALDMSALTGGSLTNVAINVAKTNLDLKTDIFEWQVADFVENILDLIGVTDYDVIKFKRRTITNDSETVTNYSAMMMDGYIDVEWAIDNNPLIADEDRKDLKERLSFAEMAQAEATFSLGEEPDATDTEIIDKAEQVASKTLTGIQTTSLIGVIEKYTAGSLTLRQAINIVSVSIGVTAEEARRIIEGLG